MSARKRQGVAVQLASCAGLIMAAMARQWRLQYPLAQESVVRKRRLDSYRQTAVTVDSRCPTSRPKADVSAAGTLYKLGNWTYASSL